MSREASVKSKILSHFIKGKVSLSPMETVLMIPGELEHLENLVKLARRKRDSETTEIQASVVSASPSIRKICVSKMHRSKTLHLPVEINDCIIEGLVDTGASMSILAAAVVRELGMMHLVTGNESYKTASGVITRALGQVEEVQVKIGEVKCSMTFMVVDTDGYDVLLGLDFLMKIGAVVDVERGLIQVRHGPGTHVEVLPLTVANFLQRINAGQGSNGAVISVKDGPADRDPEARSDQAHKVDEEEEDASVSDDESDDDEFHDSESNHLEQGESNDEFVDPEFKELINAKGPEEVLQLMLQKRTDRIMAEENSEGDDYADWIKWSFDAEENRLSEYGSTRNALGTVLPQQHSPEHDSGISVILQTAQVVTNEPDHKPGEGCVSSSYSELEVKWKEICERIKVDPNLEKPGQQLWATLERYKDIFAWNKSELGYCTIGEHGIDMQGFPPCNASPGRLSFWEEAEVKRQIDALVELGKM